MKPIPDTQPDPSMSASGRANQSISLAVFIVFLVFAGLIGYAIGHVAR